MFEEQIAAINRFTESERVSDNHNDQLSRRTYTVDDIMDILSLSRNGVYALIKRNIFHSVNIGGRIRISCKSFDAWLDNMEGNQ